MPLCDFHRLLVIFMFLLCSGGGWWYRCWLRNRFPDTQTSVTRTSTNNSMTQSRRPAILTRSRPSSMAVPPVDNLNPSGGQFQVAHVSYSSSGDRLILHRLWKGRFDRKTNNSLNLRKTINKNIQTTLGANLLWIFLIKFSDFFVQILKVEFTTWTVRRRIRRRALTPCCCRSLAGFS